MKTTRLLLPILLAGLTACSSKKDPTAENFTQAINDALGRTGQRCFALPMTFPTSIPKSEFDASAGRMGTEAHQLAVLERAGLITGAPTQMQSVGPMGAKTVHARAFSIADGSRQYFEPATQHLCYGKIALTKVESWDTPVSVGGYEGTTVRYSYHMQGTPAWAHQAEFLQEFSQIGWDVSGAGTSLINVPMTLTADGWKVE